MPLPTGAKALNLGCGLTGITGVDGWINLDNSPNARLSKYPLLKWSLWKVGILSDFHYHVQWDKSIVLADLSKGLKFDDSSIDFAYSSHFLEHISEAHGEMLVGEIFRVLKPGGIVRLVLPDLALGASRYLDALRDNPNDPEAGPCFLRWLQLNRKGIRDPHLWMYDIPSLGRLLAKCGFINITPCNFQQGRFPDCDILDCREDDSLHIEAEKP